MSVLVKGGEKVEFRILNKYTRSKTVKTVKFLQYIFNIVRHTLETLKRNKSKFYRDTSVYSTVYIVTEQDI